MAVHTKGLKGLSNGKKGYYRTIGQHLNANGKIASKKFMLGFDKQKAVIANQRLEMLWSILDERHSNAADRMLHVPKKLRPKPIWDGFELRIAEAVRKHEHVMLVAPKDLGCSDESAFASQLHFLTNQFGHIIHFVPKDPDQLTRGQEL